MTAGLRLCDSQPMAQRKTGKSRRPADFYPTPPWATELLLQHYGPDPSSLVLEPSAGDGAIVSVLRRYRYNSIAAVELRESCVPHLCSSGATHVVTGDAFVEVPKLVPLLAGLQDVSDSQPTTPKRRVSLVGNPPFSLALEFARLLVGDESGFRPSCMSSVSYVALLLRLGFLETATRCLWNNRHPVTQLLVFSRRPSFTGDSATDSYAYAWFVWDLGRPGLHLPPKAV